MVLINYKLLMLNFLLCYLEFEIINILSTGEVISVAFNFVVSTMDLLLPIDFGEVIYTQLIHAYSSDILFIYL